MSVALTIHTVRNTNLYLLLADTLTFTLPPSGIDAVTLTHDIGQSKAAVQISYPEHRYHREAAQSFVLDTSNEASVTSNDKTVVVSRDSVFTAQDSVFCTNTRMSVAAFLPPKEVVVTTEVMRNTVSYDLGDTFHVR